MARIDAVDRDYIDTGEPILRTKGLRWPAADLCVHFVNTAEGREDSLPHYGRRRMGLVPEPLKGYDAIARWMKEAGGLDDAELRQLLKLSDQFPPDAIDVNARILELRPFFQRIADGLAELRLPVAADYATFQGLINEVWPRLSFVTDDHGLWTCEFPEIDVDWPRRQLLFSMARLLTSRLRNRVRRCAGQDCTLLFIADATTGLRRKWCVRRICSERNRPKRPGY